MAEPDRLDLSVIIAVRNGAATIGDQLESLAGQQFDGRWEVIVADNGSTDTTRQIVTRFQDTVPGLRVLDASREPGPSYARNLAVRQARSDRFLFLDADDVAGPGYVAAMAAAVDDDPLVAARIDYQALNVFRRSFELSGNQERSLEAPHGFFPYASGGTLGMQRGMFERMGGFSQIVTMSEDADFCWRAQLAGYGIRFVPDALLLYRQRGSIPARYRQGRRSGRGVPWLYSRYRDLGMPRRSWRSALRFHGGAVKALVRARSKADVAAAAYYLGFRVGLVEGCFIYRVRYL